MLDVDASGIGAGEVADQFFVGWRCAEGVFGEYCQQILGPGFQPGGGEFLRVFFGMPGEDNLPRYHLSSLALLPRGSAMPFLMDSRMSGTESR